MTEPNAKGSAVRDRSIPHILREIQSAKAAIVSDPDATCRHLDNLIDLLTKRKGKGERDNAPTTPSGPALSPWQAKRLDAFIDTNLDRAIPIQELAEIARLSVGHFFRAFRGSFGTAPHSYIVARRIERAECRLRERKFACRGCA